MKFHNTHFYSLPLGRGRAWTLKTHSNPRFRKNKQFIDFQPRHGSPWISHKFTFSSPWWWLRIGPETVNELFSQLFLRGPNREQLEWRLWIRAAKHKWTSEALNHHLWLNFLASSLDETKQRLINIFLFFLIFTLNIIDNNSNRSNKTFKPKKNIPEGTHQYDLMKHAAATLGSGNLRNAVQLPEGEDVNEWIAVNSELNNNNSHRWFSCWWFHF